MPCPDTPRAFRAASRQGALGLGAAVLLVGLGAPAAVAQGSAASDPQTALTRAASPATADEKAGQPEPSGHGSGTDTDAKDGTSPADGDAAAGTPGNEGAKGDAGADEPAADEPAAANPGKADGATEGPAAEDPATGEPAGDAAAGDDATGKDEDPAGTDPDGAARDGAADDGAVDDGAAGDGAVPQQPHRHGPIRHQRPAYHPHDPQTPETPRPDPTAPSPSGTRKPTDPGTHPAPDGGDGQQPNAPGKPSGSGTSTAPGRPSAPGKQSPTAPAAPHGTTTVPQPSAQAPGSATASGVASAERPRQVPSLLGSRGQDQPPLRGEAGTVSHRSASSTGLAGHGLQDLLGGLGSPGGAPVSAQRRAAETPGVSRWVSHYLDSSVHSTGQDPDSAPSEEHLTAEGTAGVDTDAPELPGIHRSEATGRKEFSALRGPLPITAFTVLALGGVGYVVVRASKSLAQGSSGRP